MNKHIIKLPCFIAITSIIFYNFNSYSHAVNVNVNAKTLPCNSTPLRQKLLNEGSLTPKKICDETEKGENALYTLYAKHALVKNLDKNWQKLTLFDVDNYAKLMSTGRPSKNYYNMPIKQYLQPWGKGPYSFDKFAPNAIIYLRKNCGRKHSKYFGPIFAKLSKPSSGRVYDPKKRKLGFKIKTFGDNYLYQGDYCDVSIITFNECTPTGKGGFTDWGACYIKWKD